MNARAAVWNDDVLARITGVLFLVMAVGGFAGFGIIEAMIVRGDAAATAARIRAGAFDLAILGDLLAFLCDVPVAILLYLLLRKASPTLALLAAAFRLVYAAIVGADLIALLGVRLLLGGGGPLAALGEAQRSAAALFSLSLFRLGFSLALVFFALHLVLLGIALRRARIGSWVLGPLVVIGGVAYLVDSLTALFLPALNAAIAPVLAVPMVVELPLAVWLLVRGAGGGAQRAAPAVGGSGRAREVSP